MSEKLFFASDYQEGTHPLILERLLETNELPTPGYGTDEFCDSAKAKIRLACNAPDADIYFLTGGTQTNAVVITAMLAPYQGVIAAESGHIAIHEAGAIEYGGHKVMALPHHNGKLAAQDIENMLVDFDEDANHEHMIMPAMVYLSQPTEYGTLYSLEELSEIRKICQAHQVKLYVDGARLAYALACPENDVSLPDLARLCDVFYIGGTKCGALFGEAVVFPRGKEIPHFFSIIKQHGALLAKGRILGIQFDTLFTDNLYFKIGKSAIHAADRIRKALTDAGYRLHFGSPTNQIFVELSDVQVEQLSKRVEMSFWERATTTSVIMRIATSWATKDDAVDALISCLRNS